jgi:hypothetical protein
MREQSRGSRRSAKTEQGVTADDDQPAGLRKFADEPLRIRVQVFGRPAYADALPRRKVEPGFRRA